MKRISLSAIALFVGIVTAAAYTAQFHAGAGSYAGQQDFSMTEASDGAGVTLPTPTLSACSDWEFAGWIDSPLPYEPHDELTQEIYPAGTVIHLESVSEEFYAVYRYKTDRYCQIYVDDQLRPGAQYIIVNDINFEGTVWEGWTRHSISLRYPVIYPTASSISGLSIYTAYTTWNDGYVDINSSDVLTSEQRSSILYVLSETNITNNYWAMYNPYTRYYLDVYNVRGISSYTTDADCLIDRSDWNRFTIRDTRRYYIGFYEDPYNEENFHKDFFIFRQQTIFTSNPDCGDTNYTVTLDAGENGNCGKSSITEESYHTGVVLPAATPNTGGSACNDLWEFAGWTESGSVLGTDSTSLAQRLWLQGEVYYPSRNETLHAVYRRKSTTWEQVEDPNTLQAGEKIMIAYKNGSNYYLLSSTEQSTGYNASEKVAEGAIATLDDAALVWQLEGKKGAWRLKDSNGKHLDMTRDDYAYSYTYPWSRWSDEFTIAGSEDFSIRSNNATKNYLTANATKFFSQADAQSNIRIYRQVTTYSKTPKCESYTVLFNSGEGTFGTGTKKDSTIVITDVSSATGIALSTVPTAVAPGCDGWKFAGWRVGSGLYSTTNAPGVLYKSTETYIPLMDSIILYAVYQQGEGSVFYQKIYSSSEITAGSVYVIATTAGQAVTYSMTNSYYYNKEDISSHIVDNTIASTYVGVNLQWEFNGTRFIGNNSKYLSWNGRETYYYYVEGAPTSTPFILKEYNDSHYFGETSYTEKKITHYVFGEVESPQNFYIYKQATTAPHNSWPHCTPFSVILHACGGQFSAVGDTHTPVEPDAGDGVSLNSHRPTTECSSDGWTFVGWVQKHALQATEEAPAGMFAPNATYHPKQDGDQLYAVYSNGSIWTSYPACEEGIEVVSWSADGVIVESYQGLAGVPTINGVAGTANGDGTYTLPYDVASNPCTPVHIQWGTASQIVKTPIYVNNYSRLSAYVAAFGDCSDCDVVVATGGSAIVNKTDQTVRDMTVYPGGRLVIEAGKTFTASSLTMRADGDERMPSAVILGNFVCDRLYHDRRIDNSRYYWMSLPYDVTIADINYADAEANGKNAVYDTDYYMQFYDGVKRATDNGKSNTYWTHIGDITDESYQTKSTLKAGRGYLLGLPRTKQNNTGHTYRTLRFPMTVADWSSEVSVDKTVVAAGKSSDLPQHVGWNLIGNPFLQNYSAVDFSDLVCGRMTELYNEQGEWVEPWYELEEGTEEIPYISIYDPSTDSYTQTELIGHNIPPFSTALVQLPDGKTGLRFHGTTMSGSPAAAAARRMGLLNEEESTKSRFEVYVLTIDGEDKLTMILDDKHSTEYEVGSDLMKMVNNGQTNIYTHHNGVKCVFDALGYEDAGMIPVGLTMPTAGYLLFGLDKKSLSDEIAHIWLVDEDEYVQTDLLHSTYQTSSEAGTFNNRLWLRVEMKATTPTDEQSAYSVGGQTYKYIQDGQLNIQHNNRIYNANGIRVR